MHSSAAAIFVFGLLCYANLPACESFKPLSLSRGPTNKLKATHDNIFQLARNILSGKATDPSKPSNELSQIAPTKIGQTVEKYYECWNRRDICGAIKLFDDKCVYEDTLFPNKFEGKDALTKHLEYCAGALPPSFKFKLDVLSVDATSNTVGVQWHVEADGSELPFTRGCSMYTINKEGLISKGFDVPEPTVKAGAASLFILKTVKPLVQERARLLPAVAWVFYCWLLFFSTIAPGLPATSLDPQTWSLVKDLSLNFWLIVPIVAPDAAPVAHPVLEGLFNLVLAWSALLGGFLVDGKQRGNVNTMLTTVGGMQLLTNAIYLPYLVNREAAPLGEVTSEPLSAVEAAAESKAAPLLLGAVGALSVAWALGARAETFGDLHQRLDTFTSLLLHDRLTFAFAVDAVYYSLFQGWLIDDDIARREGGPQSGGKDEYVDQDLGPGSDASMTSVVVSPSLVTLSSVGKRVPFFGLVYYLLFRPTLKVPSGPNADPDFNPNLTRVE